MSDVPYSYHRYYSNPSYHTLSQNPPPLPHLPNNHHRCIKASLPFVLHHRDEEGDLHLREEEVLHLETRRRFSSLERRFSTLEMGKA